MPSFSGPAITAELHPMSHAMAMPGQADAWRADHYSHPAQQSVNAHTRFEVNYQGRSAYAMQDQTYHASNQAFVPGLPLPNSQVQSNAGQLPSLRPRIDSATATDLVQHPAKHEIGVSKDQSQPQVEATGGVSAKLDYELERMTDFVAGAAQGMYALHSSRICLADIDICRSLQPGVQIQPAFRKWVLQVLTATRLPSATILLSLHYLAVRIRDFPGSVSSSENQIYRLLAGSMILGSKFLDDNTFINRSWSDVCGIKVSELNSLEIDWLALISFDLHVSVDDANGVSTWLRAWQDYDRQMDQRAHYDMLSKRNTMQAQQMSGQQPGYQPKTLHHNGLITPLTTPSSPIYGNEKYISADPWNRTLGSVNPSMYYGNKSYHPPPHGQYQQTRTVAFDQQHYNAGNYRPILPAMAPTYPQWHAPPWHAASGYDCHCASCIDPAIATYSRPFLPAVNTMVT